MREIDQDGGGTISIDEFTGRMQQIDSRMTAGGVGTVQASFDKIFEFIEEKKFRIVDMFNKIDVDGNGKLDPLEFYMCMKQMGMELDKSEVGLIMEKLDSDGGGSIGIDEFLEEMRQIHRKRRKDEKKAVKEKASVRVSAYDKQREASRYSAGGHPAIAALGDEAKINFDRPPTPEGQAQGYRPSGAQRAGRWRPPSAERYVASHQAFDSSYQASAHQAFVYTDPQTGMARQRSLPDINAGRSLGQEFVAPDPRVGPIQGEVGAVYGENVRAQELKLNSSALNRTYVSKLDHKRVLTNSKRGSGMSAGQSRRMEALDRQGGVGL